MLVQALELWIKLHVQLMPQRHTLNDEADNLQMSIIVHR